MPIGGINDPQPQVSAGLAAQPLVTSADPSVVGAGAVENLVNSVRNGSISMSEILDRVDNVAQAGRKSRMQALGEFVSPEAIANRKQQLVTGTAQGQLAQQQAEAGQGLVGAQTDLTQEQLYRSKADINSKSALDAYMAFRPPIKKDDGSTDYDAMSRQGFPLLGAYARYQDAQAQLKVGPPIQYIDPKTKQPTMILTNGYGMPRTQESVDAAHKNARDAWDEVHELNDSYPKSAPAAAAPAAAPAPAVTPAAPAPAAAPATPADITPSQSAQMVNEMSPSNPGAASFVSMMTPAQRVSEWNARHPVVQPTTTVNPNGTVVIQHAPVPTPGTPPPAAPAQTDIQSATMLAGPIPGTAFEDVRKSLVANPGYSKWQIQQPFINSFKQEAAKIEAIPDKVQLRTPMNAHDANLLNSIAVLMNPNLEAARGPVKAEYLEEHADPRLEKVQNWRGVLNNSGATTPEGRKRLIELGRSLAAEHEQQFKGMFEGAVNSAKIGNPSATPESVLTDPNELKSFYSAGGSAGETGAPAAATPPTSSAGPVFGIKGLGNVYRGADGLYHRST